MRLRHSDRSFLFSVSGDIVSSIVHTDFFSVLLCSPIVLAGWYKCYLKRCSLRLEDMRMFCFNKVGLGYRNLDGFFRQRMIAQLMFETFPELFIKTFILWGPWREEHRQILKDGRGKVTPWELYMALTLACTNGLIQVVLLWMESRSTGDTCWDYAMTVMQGRFMWVPYLKQLQTNGVVRDQFGNVR